MVISTRSRTAASQLSPLPSGSSSSGGGAISRKRALSVKSRESTRSKKPRSSTTTTATTTASCSEAAETPQPFEFSSRDGTAVDTPATTAVVSDAEEGCDGYDGATATQAFSAKDKGKGKARVTVQIQVKAKGKAKAKGKGRPTEIPASEGEEGSDDALSDSDGTQSECSDDEHESWHYRDGDHVDDSSGDEEYEDWPIDPHRSAARRRPRPAKAPAHSDSDSDPSWESDGDGGGEPDPGPGAADDADEVVRHVRHARHHVRTSAEAKAEARAARDRKKLYTVHPGLEHAFTALDNRPLIAAEQDPQPDGLSLELLPFQREGLHWLRLQEQSDFRGGILADEMGMGKTIQTLSLMMHDPQAKPNLVVAPTVALMQWRSEIEKYTGKALSVYVFHGAAKTTDHKFLASHHVILTTYNLLESAFRKQESGFKRKAGLFKEKSALHRINYHRVILDEAHNIKDRSCNTAKAVFALKTKLKLCLSGTPLQNRIGELFSLLRFLELDPFAYYFCRKCPCKSLHWKFPDHRRCDECGHSPMAHLCYFNYACLKPIQKNGNTGDGKVAFQNIHRLLKHIMLRRTKKEREEDLGLPPKTVRIRKDYFSEEELDLYDSIYSDGKRKFDTYVEAGVVLNNYANIFTLITRMRQMADHPDLVLRKHIEDGQAALAVCHLCDDEAEDAVESKCHHTFCRDCVQRYVRAYDGDSAPECPKCHVALAIDLSQPALEADVPLKRSSIVSRIDMSKWRSSTKIEALCEELHKLRSPYQTTKSIVFSQFTSMLQLIEWRLNRAGFKTVMLEGSMSPSQREATINHFMNKVDVEVFLVSLKAGGVALNLIEASQVFLMEPWWNPSVEWQAADRIHRIGQTRVCRVTRMVIEDSIESRIVDLQDKKARMIEATVNANEEALDRLTPADMQFLFQN